jgi:hypothetical protein
MKKVTTEDPPDDFPWPDGAVPVTIEEPQLRALNVPLTDPTSVNLIFKKGTEPQQ